MAVLVPVVVALVVAAAAVVGIRRSQTRATPASSAPAKGSSPD